MPEPTTTSPASTGDRPGFEPRHPNAVPARCDGCPAPARWTRDGSRYCDEHAVLTTPMTTTSPASMGEPLSEADRLAEIRARNAELNDSRQGARISTTVTKAQAGLLHKGPADLEFLLSLVDSLQERLDTAAALHKPEDVCGNAQHTNLNAVCPECGTDCEHCGYEWPCPDANALGLDGGDPDGR